MESCITKIQGKKICKVVVAMLLFVCIVMLASCGKSENNSTQVSTTNTSVEQKNVDKESTKNEETSQKIESKSYKIDSTIQKPVFSNDGMTFSPYSIAVEGGVEAQFTATAPNQTIYYGLLDYDAYWAGQYSSWLQIREDGKKWSTKDLVSASVTSETKGAVKVTEPGKYYAYAVATEGNKSSIFNFVTVELSRASNPSIYIENGGLRQSPAGELYASLTEDMKNAVKINAGPIPNELLGETVYFQIRNMKGYADSEIWSQYVEPLNIDSPRIYIGDVVGGKEVEIVKPVIRIGSSTADPYADSSEIHVYYTLDGSTPVPGKSDEYLSPFVISEPGTYTVQAVATYGKSISDIEVGEYNFYEVFSVEKSSTPTISVSGLVLKMSRSDQRDKIFLKVGNGDYQKIDSGFVILNEDYEGKTIYISSAREGNAFSEPVVFEVKTLKDFQNKYSDNTRQFGYWVVLEEYNQYSGKPTGEYSLFARFLMGGGSEQYLYVLAIPDTQGVPTYMVFSAPCSIAIPSSDTFVTSKPYSVKYNIDSTEKTAYGDFYNLNLNNFDASYWLKLKAEENSELFEKTASSDEFIIVMTLQEEMSLGDALSVVATAYQYTNYSAVGDAMLEEIQSNLSEMQFIYSNEGYKEAVEYYKQVNKK